ncbi:MAG: LysE family transporter [Candidatus Abyssubacteria bacterium]
MTNLVAIFFASLGIGLTGAIMPGPLLALTVKESLSHGKTAPLWLACGHSLCELVMVAALVGGVINLFSVNALTGPVGLLGGAMLLYMGIGAFKEVRAGSIPDTSSTPINARNLLLGGAAVSVLNPYWTVWWLTAGLAQVVIAQKAGEIGIISFYAGHISADFLWFGVVGLVASSGTRMFEGKLYRGVLQACGIFLFVFGLVFAIYGMKTLHSVFNA